MERVARKVMNLIHGTRHKVTLVRGRVIEREIGDYSGLEAGQNKGPSSIQAQGWGRHLSSPVIPEAITGSLGVFSGALRGRDRIWAKKIEALIGGQLGEPDQLKPPE